MFYRHEAHAHADTPNGVRAQQMLGESDESVNEFLCVERRWCDITRRLYAYV